MFHIFGLDPEWEQDVGREGAANRELEVGLDRRSKGPVVVTARGPSLSVIVDVLAKYLAEFPSCGILKKWVSDVIVAPMESVNLKRSLQFKTTSESRDDSDIASTLLWYSSPCHATTCLSARRTSSTTPLESPISTRTTSNPYISRTS